MSILVCCEASAQLNVRLEMEQSNGVFVYTLYNEEPLVSSTFVCTLHMAVGAPITVIQSPEGWDFVTDGSTYVDWITVDGFSPYGHDVAPGATAIFVIQSDVIETTTESFMASSWNHAMDTPGPQAVEQVSVPFLRGAPGCAADINGDAQVNSQDFFDFLVAFFGETPPADFNSDGVVNSQDFFDFLAAFFNGC
jgi:hypothetical protein